MHPSRLKALQAISNRESVDSKPLEKRVSEFYGVNTFRRKDIKERLSSSAFKAYEKAANGQEHLDEKVAEEVAKAVKEWALEKGATHFTHWFQPLTGSTAEKHDSFISYGKEEGTVIEKFSASQLIQSEPDASSFPSGGMRTTFEARGYTAWDLSSPLFVVEHAGSVILCIPSVFVSYTGHSLDTKMGLLRSMKKLGTVTSQLLETIGEKKVQSVECTIGCEQEYFLVDRNYYNLRPDLVMSGRTLLGFSMARGQQLEDHYFGSIPTRVQAFIKDLETELYKLGIPCKTRHNEVAPAQFELAPIFEQANVASDHNMLTMEVLKRCAQKHQFECLMHEKPFAEINGSGKHNNWSLATDKGENLLEPGATPAQNIRFLVVLSCVLKAVFDEQVALRASIASHGNDHRLGANEAPPAIISVFLGATLSQIMETLEQGGDLSSLSAEKVMMEFGLNELPSLPKDNTDRNRTSPFAFTGNKFEFRAVGSSQAISFPATILNSAVTMSMQQFIERVEAKKSSAHSLESAVLDTVKEFVIESKNIRFEGNGYGDEWRAEAKKRGLYELLTTPDALEAVTKPEHHKFLIESETYNEAELQSILNVRLERYSKHCLIEAKTLMTMTQQQVFPALCSYLAQLNAVTSKNKVTDRISSKITQHMEAAQSAYDTLEQNIEAADNLEEKLLEQSKFIVSKVLPQMEALRKEVDVLEELCSDDLWPLPKYQEMLFIN